MKTEEAFEISNGYAKETINSKSDSKNTELLEQVAIEGTPFHAIRIEDKWFLTMGKYRLTETLPTLEACKEEATDASWHRIMQIMHIVIKETKREIIDETIKEIVEDHTLKGNKSKKNKTVN